MEPYDFPNVACHLSVRHLRREAERLAIEQAVGPIELAWALTFLASELTSDNIREQEDEGDVER